jgi:cytochrome P450
MTTPRPLPGPSLIKSVLGHITSAGRWMVPGLRALEKQYGRFYRLRFGIRDVVCVSDPELTEEFLVRSGDLPKGPSKCPVQLFLGEGLLFSEGALWRRQRQAMAPYLTPRKVEQYSDDMSAVVRDRVGSWHDGQHIDVSLEMAEITVRILSRSLFGDSVPEAGARTMQSIMNTGLEDIALLLNTWRLWVPKWWPLPARRRLVALRSEADKIIEQALSSRIEGGVDEDDLLGRLLSLQDEHGEPVERRVVADEILILLLAGHETTATTLVMIWTLLTQHPEIRDRVMHEIDHALGGKELTSEDIHHLPLTSAVIKETLRLYPPVWAMDRLATENRVVRGKRISAGSSIMLFPLLMHSNPDVFREPNDFFPDRWLNDGGKDIPPHAFIPFGRGRRACIGQHFAQRELLITVVTVLQQWTIECSNADSITMSAGMVLRPTSNVTGVVHARSQ